jgi:hypothetical protein
MVAPGNVNKHRYGRDGIGKVVEEQKWGRDKARERYGPLKYEQGAPRPADASRPQRLGDSNNLQGPGYRNDTSGWVRGEGGTAETKPNFDRGIRRPGKV